jgi:hypothetical protein
VITVLMQRHGGKDLLDAALSHSTKYRQSYTDRFPYGCAYCPENGKHPEDQVKWVKRVVQDCRKQGWMRVIATHSLTIIYALNNALLRYPNLELVAYEILPNQRRKLASHKDKETGQLWIDESLLGDVGCELSTEMNQLLTRNWHDQHTISNGA